MILTDLKGQKGPPLPMRVIADERPEMENLDMSILCTWVSLTKYQFSIFESLDHVRSFWKRSFAV